MKLLFVFMVLVVQTSWASPGATDKNGCHTCRTNCLRYDYNSGEYHCHGSIPLRRVLVERIVDGDTILVSALNDAATQYKVRLLGIDCPESSRNRKCISDAKKAGRSRESDIPIGKRAKAYANKLLKGRFVFLEAQRAAKLKKDFFGRYLAYVRMENGKDFGAEMLKNGLCRDFSKKYPHQRKESYAKIARVF